MKGIFIILIIIIFGIFIYKYSLEQNSITDKNKDTGKDIDVLKKGDFLPKERIYYHALSSTKNGVRWYQQINVDADQKTSVVNQLIEILGQPQFNNASPFASTDHASWRRIFTFEHNKLNKNSLDSETQIKIDKLKKLGAINLDTSKYL